MGSYSKFKGNSHRYFLGDINATEGVTGVKSDNEGNEEVII